MTPLDLTLLTPLITLAVAAMVLLLAGAWGQNRRHTAKAVAGLAATGLLALAAHMLFHPAIGVPFQGQGSGYAMLNFSPYTNLAQVILCALAALAVPLVAPGLIAHPKSHRPEIYVLLLLMLAGAFVLTAAQDFLAFYLGLELMSFPLYILAAFNRDDAKSSEAALKYFVLGGLVSGLFLFGASLLYAAVGSTHFAALAGALAQPITPLLAVACALLIVSLLFKLSVVPFHMWTPDVYEGAPTPVTAIMASLPKLAAFIFLVRLLDGPMTSAHTLWQPALAGLAMLSMLGGASVAVVQTSLKRLLAWSTIANVGFIMVGVVAANTQGAAGVLFYLAVYGATQLGLFAVAMELEAAGLTTIPQLAGLSQRSPRLAAILLVLLFSLAGVPPLAGFFAKIGVFGAAVAGGWTILALVGVVASVVAAFYSLWLIKLMYFDAPAAPNPVGGAWHAPLGVVALLAAGITLLLGLFPGLLANLTLPAATALF